MPDNARRNLNNTNLGHFGRNLTMKLTRRTTMGVMMTAAAAVMSLSTAAFADGHQKMDSIHFLIPGGAGGGWDGTARGTGQALTESGLVGSASYENMSGGG
ncbi:MAG: putative tricarboxylic transport membrane protein, partial [Gammaproteobacteria bacterium]